MVTLDHPPLNILTRDVMTALRGAFSEIARDETLRVVVLDAVGKHFSAGADVEEHLPPEHESMIPEFVETIIALEECPVPIIASVRGRCLGGGFELVMPADIIIASETASFGQPEIMLGVIPPAACALLPEMVPGGLASWIVYSGEAVKSAEAEKAGLVTRIVPDADLESETSKFAGKISRHSAAAVRFTKKAMRAGRIDRVKNLLNGAGDLYVNELMKTQDANEGLKAFTEKRSPVWSHS